MPLRYVYPEFSERDIIPDYIGCADCTRFDLRKGHSVLIMLLSNPTSEELKKIRYLPVEARLTCLADVLWLTFRFGDSGFTEAPFSPHLATNAQLPQDLNRACDYMQVIVVDTTDGRVRIVRAIQFSEAFSAALRVGCLCLLPQKFNADVYDAQLSYVQTRYSVDEIASAAAVIFKATDEDECVIVED